MQNRGGDHPRQMRMPPAHEALEGSIEPVEIGGEHVFGEGSSARPPVAEPFAPEHGLLFIAGEQHRSRRRGFRPGAEEEVAPVGRRAHDALRLQDAQHAGGRRGPCSVPSEPEGLGSLGQHRRHDGEAMGAQRQGAEAIDVGQPVRVALQQACDLPAAPGEAGLGAERQCGGAHGGAALLAREGRFRRARRLESEQVLEGRRLFEGRRRLVLAERGVGGEAEHGGEEERVAHHAPSSGAAQSRRTARRPASTVSVPAAPSWMPASRRRSISARFRAVTATIAGRTGRGPAAMKP